ncbi:MAG: peptide chain release factor N(5)-glutamine methyltransferase [Solirubrobacterales bacterium]
MLARAAMSAAAAATGVGDALAAATDAFAAAGIDTARLDAEILAAEVTGRDRAALAAHPERELSGAEARALAAMVRRRVRREPVAYILGRKGFRGIELAVDGRVLIPRPETELLVEVALEADRARPGEARESSLSVLDVGTGSGAVGLAIAHELPGARVTLTDASPDALRVARANAADAGLDAVGFVEGSLPPGPAAHDLIVANLPYVSEAEWEGLAPEIREYEPRDALVAGPTGLEAVESVLGALGERGIEAGMVALELGAGQTPAVAELLARAGYPRTGVRADLAGIERVVTGERAE